MMVTNAFEGADFVDPSAPANVSVSNYVANSFPTFGTKEADAVAALYKDLGSAATQIGLILGEGIRAFPFILTELRLT